MTHPHKYYHDARISSQRTQLTCTSSDETIPSPGKNEYTALRHIRLCPGEFISAARDTTGIPAKQFFHSSLSLSQSHPSSQLTSSLFLTSPPTRLVDFANCKSRSRAPVVINCPGRSLSLSLSLTPRNIGEPPRAPLSSGKLQSEISRVRSNFCGDCFLCAYVLARAALSRSMASRARVCLA